MTWAKDTKSCESGNDKESPEHFPFICLILIASGKDFAPGLAYQLQAKLPTRLRRPADCTNTHTRHAGSFIYVGSFMEKVWQKALMAKHKKQR